VWVWWCVHTPHDPNLGNNLLSIQFFVQPPQAPTTLLPSTEATSHSDATRHSTSLNNHTNLHPDRDAIPNTELERTHVHRPSGLHVTSSSDHSHSHASTRVQHTKTEDTTRRAADKRMVLHTLRHSKRCQRQLLGQVRNSKTQTVDYLHSRFSPAVVTVGNITYEKPLLNPNKG
jgi:hypothetical protein